MFRFLLLFVLSVVAPGMGKAQADEKGAVLFHEDFANLDNWKPLHFPKIAKHSVYTLNEADGKHVLKAASDASASGLVFRDPFNVYEYPRARWRWSVANVYQKADGRTKAGDDYPIRVYIMFEYDPEKAGALDRLTYGVAKQLYGEYPPHSSLSYVWASTEDAGSYFPSPFTDKAMMVVLRAGSKHLGVWQEESVDIVSDYRRAFKTEPPPRARIAIMNDSDNTGERSESFMEFIEVFR